MASGSQIDHSEDEDLRNWTVPELISSLNCAFRDSEFAIVERVLAAREEELKREIETCWNENKRIKEIEAFMVSREGKLRQEIELLKENHDFERLEKIAIEAELKNCREEILKKKDVEAELKMCRREVLELRGQNLTLKAEMKRLMQDVNITVGLQMKVCDLECAKLRAETEASVYRRRCEEMERRVFRLEKDTALFVKLENVEPVGFRNEEVHVAQGRSEGHVNFCLENVMLEAYAGTSCQYAVNSNGNIENAGSEKPPCRGIVDNTDFALGAALDTEERVADIANIYQAGAGNGTKVLKRKHNEGVNYDCLNAQHMMHKPCLLIDEPVTSSMGLGLWSSDKVKKECNPESSICERFGDKIGECFFKFLISPSFLRKNIALHGERITLTPGRFRLVTQDFAWSTKVIGALSYDSSRRRPSFPNISEEFRCHYSLLSSLLEFIVNVLEFSPQAAKGVDKVETGMSIGPFLGWSRSR